MGITELFSPSRTVQKRYVPTTRQQDSGESVYKYLQSLKELSKEYNLQTVTVTAELHQQENVLTMAGSVHSDDLNL